MQFNSLKMVGFKKYVDSSVGFGGGLNIFYGPNEAGKSTLHQAIITGLYGLSPGADSNLLSSKEDARSWQNVLECTIELDYHAEDGRYVVRRDIENGEVELYRAGGDGERSLLSGDPHEIGNMIASQTGIEDAYVFNRTVSVCQADLVQASDMHRIGSNIESLFAGAAAITASDAAELLKKNVRKPLRKSGNESPGRLDQLTERLESLITEIEKARAEDQRREDLARHSENLQRRLPVKEGRLKELIGLIEKGEAKRKLDDALEENRRRFSSLQERIRNIEECARKLEELQQNFADMGTITLFDPDQLDSARAELERARSDLEARASACSDRIQAMQKRMKAAEELSGGIALIEQQIVEFGRLAAEDDLDVLDARRREVAEKFRAAEHHVREQNDRLEHIKHSLWGLEQFAKKYPNLGDAWKLQSQWQRLELRKDEHKRSLEHAKFELADHEEHRPPPTFGNMFAEIPPPLAFLGLFVSALIVGKAYLSFPILGVALGVGAWWTVSKTKRRSRREQWRADHKRLQGEVTETEARWREICDRISEFTIRIGVTEEQVGGFIDEYRSNQDDLRSLRREHEQCLRDRDQAVGARDEVERQGTRLAETYGTDSLAALRDRIGEVRGLRREIEKLSERLAGVLELDRVSRREEMLLAASEVLAELHDERKRIEKEQMDLARRESEFLQRTSCDDILQLAERTRKLRAMLASKEKLASSLEAHAAGRSLEQLKTDQNGLTLEIKVARARLQEEFSGFEVTDEQFEFWRKEKARLEEELPQLAKELTAARTELALLEEHAFTSPAELEGEKRYVEAQIEHGDFIVTACNAAIDVLREVQQEHRDIYLPRLEEESGAHFGQLTRGAYSAVNLAEKWPAGLKAVDRTGREVDAEKLSRGTIDQLYFSLRLALAKALSGRTTLPLILDDPFVHFDPDRFEEAVNTIIGLVQEGRQIVYFTHDSQLAEREDELRQKGIDVHCVRLGE